MPPKSPVNISGTKQLTSWQQACQIQFCVHYFIKMITYSLEILIPEVIQVHPYLYVALTNLTQSEIKFLS